MLSWTWCSANWLVLRWLINGCVFAGSLSVWQSATEHCVSCWAHLQSRLPKCQVCSEDPNPRDGPIILRSHWVSFEVDSVRAWIMILGSKHCSGLVYIWEVDFQLRVGIQIRSGCRSCWRTTLLQDSVASRSYSRLLTRAYFMTYEWNEILMISLLCPNQWGSLGAMRFSSRQSLPLIFLYKYVGLNLH